MSMQTLTTAHLPERFQAPVEASAATPVQVLTCQHGPACPTCVLEAARALLASDATLVVQVYTG